MVLVLWLCTGSERNVSKLTLDGVDVMGERLAQEVGLVSYFFLKESGKLYWVYSIYLWSGFIFMFFFSSSLRLCFCHLKIPHTIWYSSLFIMLLKIKFFCPSFLGLFLVFYIHAHTISSDTLLDFFLIYMYLFLIPSFLFLCTCIITCLSQSCLFCLLAVSSLPNFRLHLTMLV